MIYNRLCILDEANLPTNLVDADQNLGGLRAKGALVNMGFSAPTLPASFLADTSDFVAFSQCSEHSDSSFGPGQALHCTQLPTMAPIVDETVDALKELVHKLESRVQQLEARLEGRDGAPAQPSNSSVRMILMGPPGAGTCTILPLHPLNPGANSYLQVRAPKLRRSRTSTVPATL